VTAHPSYEVVRPVTPLAQALLQNNPGPMTLDGTNTWIVSAPDADEAVVIDPGQSGGDRHLRALLAAAPRVAMVLLTHGHPDHHELAGALRAATGAPVRAVDPALCDGAAPLHDDEVVSAAGVELRVVATPGHTSDSASFILGPDSAVFTGDTVLGRGTTVVAHPDGNLGAYLDSLRRLRDLGNVPVLPGHGPELDSAAAAAQFYLEHRAQRLEQVRDALAELGPDASAQQIVATVYADVDAALWPAAELSVEAQLEYLRRPPGQ
jgi:glyoxylase-like metal-dependent hydrolase (beta-lactamase superfamily II)